jgi:hypothetical protein
MCLCTIRAVKPAFKVYFVSGDSIASVVTSYGLEGRGVGVQVL